MERNEAFSALTAGYRRITGKPMAKLIYKPFGILFGVLAGLIAKQLFERAWAVISDEPPADPEA